MCGKQFILLNLIGAINPENIHFTRHTSIWPVCYINQYQVKSAEQIECQVPCPPLKYGLVYTIVYDNLIIMRYWRITLCQLHPLLLSCMLVYFFSIFMSLIAMRCKTRNALYATCMEMLIETALLNVTQTVSWSSFDITPWIAYIG